MGQNQQETVQHRFFTPQKRYVPCLDEAQLKKANGDFIILSEAHWTTLERGTKQIVAKKTGKKYTMNTYTFDCGQNRIVVVEDFDVLRKSAMVGVTYVPYVAQDNSSAV